MAESLLAHLYTHIRGSQEDIATLSLQYIISQSEELKKCFNSVLGRKLHVNLSEVTKYSCQATGEKLERPDMSGVDILGNELILCEMKFYAGLTGNQPLTYLDRLSLENGKGLIFVCPEARVTGLWNKLIESCKERNIEIIDKSCALVDNVPMAIISWREILTELHDVAVASVPEALSDLNQLSGYCNQMDMESFIPFTSEELGSITARKQQRFYQVIIETMELIQSDERIIKARFSSYNGGQYEYKFMFNGQYWAHLAYDENLWISNDSKETPFWLLIGNEQDKQEKKILEILRLIPEQNLENNIYQNLTYIALEPLVNATLEEVTEDLKRQVYKYLEMF